VHDGDGVASKTDEASDSSQINTEEGSSGLDDGRGLSVTGGCAAEGSSYVKGQYISRGR